jgi:hypothetical protein
MYFDLAHFCARAGRKPDPSEAPSSDVHPFLSAVETDAPLSSSSRATASCPFSEAPSSGVHPFLSAVEADAPLSSSSRATAKCPFSEAQMSAVDPSVPPAEAHVLHKIPISKPARVGKQIVQIDLLRVSA